MSTPSKPCHICGVLSPFVNADPVECQFHYELRRKAEDALIIHSVRRLDGRRGR